MIAKPLSYCVSWFSERPDPPSPPPAAQSLRCRPGMRSSERAPEWQTLPHCHARCSRGQEAWVTACVMILRMELGSGRRVRLWGWDPGVYGDPSVTQSTWASALRKDRLTLPLDLETAIWLFNNSGKRGIFTRLRMHKTTKAVTRTWARTAFITNTTSVRVVGTVIRVTGTRARATRPRVGAISASSARGANWPLNFQPHLRQVFRSLRISQTLLDSREFATNCLGLRLKVSQLLRHGQELGVLGHSVATLLVTNVLHIWIKGTSNLADHVSTLCGANRTAFCSGGRCCASDRAGCDNCTGRCRSTSNSSSGGGGGALPAPSFSSSLTSELSLTSFTSSLSLRSVTAARAAIKSLRWRARMTSWGQLPSPVGFVARASCNSCQINSEIV